MLQATHEFAVQVTTDVEKALSQTLPSPLNNDDFVLGSLSGRFLRCLQLQETPAKQVYAELFFGPGWMQPTDSFTAELTRHGAWRYLDYDRAARTCEFYAGMFPEHLKRPGTVLGLEHFLGALAVSYHAMGEHFPEYRMISSNVDAVIKGFQLVSGTFSWRELAPRQYQLN